MENITRQDNFLINKPEFSIYYNNVIFLFLLTKIYIVFS